MFTHGLGLGLCGLQSLPGNVRRELASPGSLGPWPGRCFAWPGPDLQLFCVSHAERILDSTRAMLAGLPKATAKACDRLHGRHVNPVLYNTMLGSRPKLFANY